MMKLSCDVITALKGRTLVTAESCTGGGVGAALTAVSGSSSVYKGGIISYTNEIKESLLRVDRQLLHQYGAVSAPVAEAMAVGARETLGADIAISITGLAGPGGDEFQNPIGTVFVGYSDINHTISNHYIFNGDREQVRRQATEAALNTIICELGRDFDESN